MIKRLVVMFIGIILSVSVYGQKIEIKSDFFLTDLVVNVPEQLDSTLTGEAKLLFNLSNAVHQDTTFKTKNAIYFIEEDNSHLKGVKVLFNEKGDGSVLKLAGSYSDKNFSLGFDLSKDPKKQNEILAKLFIELSSIDSLDFTLTGQKIVSSHITRYTVILIESGKIQSTVFLEFPQNLKDKTTKQILDDLMALLTSKNP